ncbi:hypothetical protein PB01_17105 [Psychrobacillus glaciei]|uniref:DNA polymerase III beta sliding clamp N-terminal domain-containing protein n=1 Tax=Psychrobacillus glaciei TaxID=2283160 RepID=A0A5J6SS40_9BACI|nr:hypothetical protein PB01_17105 [Psychrobacillus glaciei]
MILNSCIFKERGFLWKSFIIQHEYFNKAISDVMRIISNKNIIPILSGIKINAFDNKIELIDSNSKIIVIR